MPMKRIKTLFTPVDDFDSEEWIRKEQITAMLTFAFFFGIGVLPFAYVRWNEGNHLVAISQLLLGIFLLGGSWKLRNDKSFYGIYSLYFFLFFLGYTFIIFFYVPSNHLNILWVVVVPIFIFFFLDRKAGNIVFGFSVLFIGYLLLSHYPYTIAEYVTLIAAFLVTTFVMYVYETVKEAEKERMKNYTRTLQQEIALHTTALKELNESLEERVQQEVSKRLLQEQMLVRQHRMASVGEMTDAIAHQWRQPLMNINAILLNIDRSVDASDNPYLTDKIEELSDITMHMAQTIEDFRDLFKTQKQAKNFSPLRLCEETLTLMSGSLKMIDVHVHGDKNVWMHGYKNELMQVLLIVLSNARDVLMVREERLRRIDITLHTEEEDMFLTVQDTGGGIDSKHLEQIFDPYFTTKEDHGGSGLGLYVARIIMEHTMRGRLTVRNIAGGAAFTMRIPECVVRDGS